MAGAASRGEDDSTGDGAKNNGLEGGEHRCEAASGEGGEAGDDDFVDGKDPRRRRAQDPDAEDEVAGAGALDAGGVHQGAQPEVRRQAAQPAERPLAYGRGAGEDEGRRARSRLMEGQRGEGSGRALGLEINRLRQTG